MAPSRRYATPYGSPPPPRSPGRPARPVGRRRRLHGRSRDDDQLRRVASVERQREDLLVTDDIADAGALDVDQRRGAFHGDGLFELAHRELGVEDGRGPYLQHDAGLYVGSEPR
jgi:hypothetical protein